MQHKIAPSILSADFGQLERDIQMINQSQADWFHVDVMDGVFVPNISFGFPVMQTLKQHAQKPLDVHLMIVDPDRYIARFAEYGTAVLTVHIEACTHLHRTLQAIKAAGMKAGVAVNPHTNVNQLSDVLGDLDLVCLMSVNPGFGGQSFIENTYRKIEQLKTMQAQQGVSFEIEIDGGVTLSNYKRLIDTGATVLVAGNTVFSAASPSDTIAQLKQ
ncbi:MAG: Ribulose-phosphate 3-epimerase [Bacteroidota bacterium]|jgi:ribulose-phosphate 3-epimerase